MGRAAKRKKQNLKQQQQVLHPVEIQLPNYHLTVEELQKIPSVAKLFDQIERLPQINCYLLPQALELFQSFEKLANRYYQLEVDEQKRQVWAAAPAIALDIAKTLHIINSLAVDDTVDPAISRQSLEYGIALACQNLRAGNWRVVPNPIPTGLS